MNNSTIRILGRRPLAGTVRISGAKNAALPALAASCLTDAPLLLDNIPQVEDIHVLIQVLREIGAEGELQGNRIAIRLPAVRQAAVTSRLAEAIRASVLLLGPLLARHGEVRVRHPGGCAIGERKIDFHLLGLQQMGAEIRDDGEFITARCPRLRGVEFTFPGKTVTGTENLLMAAALAEGTTVLHNCALEPEIADLIDLLCAMGAQIEGRGGETLVISGRPSLHGATHTIIPDRIEAGTYCIIGCFSESSLTVENVVPDHIAVLLEILGQSGVELDVQAGRITVHRQPRPRPLQVETAPYPGFPTDLQAQITTLMTQCPGTSRLRETIFNGRFGHVHELRHLGAAITIHGDTVQVEGPTPLRAAALTTTDLRASAALVLGAMLAEGETTIANAYQLFRGYEDITGKLQKIGADITICTEKQP